MKMALHKSTSVRWCLAKFCYHNYFCPAIDRQLQYQIKILISKEWLIKSIVKKGIAHIKGNFK